jgi:transcriptional regulator with XRE-family HTH domain
MRRKMTMNVADVTARVARNVQRARIERGLTQEQIGERMDPPVARNWVGMWERGSRRPNEFHLLQIAEILQRDIGWFYAEHNGASPT